MAHDTEPEVKRNAAGDYAVLENNQWRVVPKEVYEMGGLKAFGSGTERSLQQLAGGVLDAYYGLTGQGQSEVVAGEGMRGSLRDVQQDQAAAFDPIQQQYPKSALAGQAAPYLATAPAGGASLMAQAGIAAGFGLLGTSGDTRERLVSGVQAGAMGWGGAALGNMAGRIYGFAKNAFKPGSGFREGVAGDFVATGGKVTPGQAVDSTALQYGETVMESAGALSGLKKANEQLLQTQAGRAIGQADDAIDLTSTGLGNTADDIGDTISGALKGVDDINIEDELIEKIRQVKSDSPYIDFPDPDATMSGKTYQQVRSQMAAVARSEATTGSKTPGKLKFVSDIIDELDQKFLNAASPAAAKQLKTGREQWRNLLAIEKGQAVTPDGIVNPKSMRTAMNNIWGKTARRGKYGRVSPETKELMQGVNAQSSRALTSVVGDSGTATRQLLGLGLGSLVGGSAGYAQGDLSTGLMAGLGTLAAMKMYGRGGNILAREILPGAAGIGRAATQGLMAE